MTEHIEPGKVRSFEENRQIPLLKTSPPTTASSENNSLKETKKTEEAAGDPDDSVPPPAASDEVYPGDHGDPRAILISVGVFFALFVGFGILNIPGTFQTYWVNNQLKEYSQGTVSWIAATQFFLTLFGSVFTGRWFDLHGGKVSHLWWRVLISREFYFLDRLCFVSRFLWSVFVLNTTNSSLHMEYYHTLNFLTPRS